ncbi:hypothetical protein MP228_012960 [Amoeboaphelidium protococcarum]|nr:hypothetical protein MP228_012960 [Amoeboaphelidium protococcarum]
MKELLNTLYSNLNLSINEVAHQIKDEYLSKQAPDQSNKQTVKDLLQAASTDKLVMLERAVNFLYDHWKPISRDFRSAPASRSQSHTT